MIKKVLISTFILPIFSRCPFVWFILPTKSQKRVFRLLRNCCIGSYAELQEQSGKLTTRVGTSSTLCVKLQTTKFCQ